MSEPFDSFSFEQYLNDDSLTFGEDYDIITDFNDFEAAYPALPSVPPAPEELGITETDQSLLRTDLASNNDLASPSHVLHGYIAPQRSLLHGSTSRLAEGSLKKRHYRCKECKCSASYVRKGDLSRHNREVHSGIEYLCPQDNCLWHREGYGFKRLHRLVTHLLTPPDSKHPRAITSLDAKFIAVDYNDSLVSTGHMILGAPCEIKEKRVLVHPWHVASATSILVYADRLFVLKCPIENCSSFVALGLQDPNANLLKHLNRDHKMPWLSAVDLAKETIQARWSDQFLENAKNRKSANAKKAAPQEATSSDATATA